MWARHQALIEAHTHVSPLRWVNEFRRKSGTSIYLQALLGEASDITLTSPRDAEWIILSDARRADIQHARGKQFRRVRDSASLADSVAIDWSLRSYMETMYLHPTNVTFTLMGKPVDTKLLLRGDLGLQTPRAQPLRPNYSLSLPGNNDSVSAGTLHMSYSSELHRSALTGVHIYWHNILIESFLNVSFDPLSDADHGYLGTVELDDGWGLSPLNHKQGFNKSAAKYAQLKDEITSLWRSHVADRRKAEQDAADRGRPITDAVQKLEKLRNQPRARAAAAAAAWRLYPEWQVRQWADKHHNERLIKAADKSGSLSALIDLLVELEVDPPSVEKMRDFILLNSGDQFIVCGLCRLGRRVTDALIKKFEGRAWKCADSSEELKLVCGQKRAEDELGEDETEVSETVQGRAIVTTEAAQETKQRARQQRSAHQSLLAVDSSQFTLFTEQRLGSGQSSTVCLGLYYGVAVAVKLLNGTDLSATPSPQLIRSFNREVHVLSQLQHPLLIRMLFYNSEQLAIGFEYYEEYVPVATVFGEAAAPASSAPTRSTDTSPTPSLSPTLEDALCVLLDVAKGVCFMHSRHFLHRDLSPSNILLHPDTWSIKILDFGESTMLRKEERSNAGRLTGQSDIGTAVYKAPERWRGDDITAASDVFSFGVMSWELITRRQAWRKHDLTSSRPKQRNRADAEDTALTYEQIRDAILEGTRPRFDPVHDHDVPADLQQLIARCWHAEVKQRPTMEVVVEELRAVQHSLLHGVAAFRRRYSTTVVYRVLSRFDVEGLLSGQPIRARQPDSSLSLYEHVKNGSKPNTAARSPFISTTRAFSWAVHYACKSLHEEKTESNEEAKAASTSTAQPRRSVIVRIDLARLQPADWAQVYDISLPRFASAHNLETMAHNYAVDAMEVLLRLSLTTQLITGWFEVRPSHIPAAADRIDSASDMSKLPPFFDSSGKPHKYSPRWNKLFARKFESNMGAIKRLLEIAPLERSEAATCEAATRAALLADRATHASAVTASARGNGSGAHRNGGSSGTGAASSRSEPAASVPAAASSADTSRRTTKILAKAAPAQKRPHDATTQRAPELIDAIDDAARKRSRLSKLSDRERQLS